MIRIAICDDEVKEQEHTERLLQEYSACHLQYQINISLFHSPLELMMYISEHGAFDVLLLDIYMDGLLGIDMARELRNLGDKSEIIFLTKSKEHAIEAFEVDAVHYLVKPYSDENFFTVLDKIMYRLEKNKALVVTLKTTSGITRLVLGDVVFTQTSRNNYQIINTIKGDTYEVRMTATELFELLSKCKGFVRCGVSYNINLRYIHQISKDNIVFDTGHHIAYPYRVYPKLKEDFLNFQLSNED